MSKTNTTHLLLLERVRRMAGMAAARTGQTLSDYVSRLIVADADDTGVAALVVHHEKSESKEVSR